MSDLAAITGGAGFIGSHLAEGFVMKGYAVRTLDNLTTGSMINLARTRNEVDFRAVDIRNLKGLTEAFRDVSVVLHHAGMSSVPHSFEDLTYTHEVNVTGTLNVLTAALRAGVRKVINASSSSVYGNNGAELQTEGAVPSPLSPYGLSKWMGELYAAQFARRSSRPHEAVAPDRHLPLLANFNAEAGSWSATDPVRLEAGVQMLPRPARVNRHGPGICSAPCWTRAFRASIEDCTNSDLCNLIRFSLKEANARLSELAQRWRLWP